MEIVSKVRSRLVDNLGPERFELWIGSDVQFAVERDCLTVGASSQFRLDRLRKGLCHEIELVAKQAIGEQATVEFRVNPLDENASADEAVSVAAATLETDALARELTSSSESPTPLRVVAVDANDPPPTAPRLAAGPGGVRRDLAGRRFANLRSFVAGDCNRLAHSSARMVIDRPGEITPLYLYGETGVGKTHLVEGMWSEMRRRGGRRVIYLTAEQFTNYFVQALRGSGLPSFRQKYRGVELLIIDDVQFLAGKQATAIELISTIDSLLRESRQIVLTADRSPAELTGFGSELLARVAGGLVCELQPLDFATRTKVLTQLARTRSVTIERPLIERIADRAPGDARQLSGLLNRLWATSQAHGSPIDSELVDRVTQELFRSTKQVVRLNDIEKAVCAEFGVEPEQLRSDKRVRRISQPRMLAMWLARKHTRAALAEISEFFGRRSHSTVVSAQSQVDRWLAEQESLHCSRATQSVEEIVSRIERKLWA